MDCAQQYTLFQNQIIIYIHNANLIVQKIKKKKLKYIKIKKKKVLIKL